MTYTVEERDGKYRVIDEQTGETPASKLPFRELMDGGGFETRGEAWTLCDMMNVSIKHADAMLDGYEDRPVPMLTYKGAAKRMFVGLKRLEAHLGIAHQVGGDPKTDWVYAARLVDCILRFNVVDENLPFAVDDDECAVPLSLVPRENMNGNGRIEP